MSSGSGEVSTEGGWAPLLDFDRNDQSCSCLQMLCLVTTVRAKICAGKKIVNLKCEILNR